jgi:hypothetical protein
MFLNGIKLIYLYLLAEVWLPGEDKLLVVTTKGAHQSQTVKGQKATK